jgi:GT2 family glycosyltransferase
MSTSVIIPLWHGASVITRCLEALAADSDAELLEVICVDNASPDESARLVSEQFPQVRLLRQPVNLGFAGGVNVGMRAARGDTFILLNQDCLVQPGWLVEFTRALQAHPEFGIAGCTILNPDGTVNHAGAAIRWPDACGVHSTATGDGGPRRVDYVTGAAFAIRRSTWATVGLFDDGYYPAYFEETDYCYRARRKGIETGYLPGPRVAHLFSSREWEADPVRHTANQHTSRYRFVCKHSPEHGLPGFFEFERAAVDAERFLDQVVARFLAARDTLRRLPDILDRRRLDLGEPESPDLRRQLQVGFTNVMRRAFAVAETLSQAGLVEPEREAADDAQQPDPQMAAFAHELATVNQQLGALRQRERELLARIDLLPLDGTRSDAPLRRLLRLLILRPASLLMGRHDALMSDLKSVHVATLEQIGELNRVREQQARHQTDRQTNRLRDRLESLERRMRHRLESLDRRMQLLETLTDYDYR